MQEEVLIDAAECLHDFVGGLAVQIGACLLVLGELDEHQGVPVQALNVVAHLFESPPNFIMLS